MPKVRLNIQSQITQEEYNTLPNNKKTWYCMNLNTRKFVKIPFVVAYNPFNKEMFLDEGLYLFGYGQGELSLKTIVKVSPTGGWTEVKKLIEEQKQEVKDPDYWFI
jgi:hypothetical protein